MISKDLLLILACPDCKSDVKEENNTIICVKCKRIYPIEDDIPIMLIEKSYFNKE